MSGSPQTDAAVLLEQLDVPRGRILYVQASADWIRRAGLDVSSLLAALLDFTGCDGTLVMPSYPFNTTHQEYLESRPVYDVRRTPSGIGFLPEIFRRTAGAVRSLDPDFCVTAKGRDAEAIVGSEPAAPDPFGEDSSYQRMIDRRATLVGLGVSLNTNSFIHLVDSRAGAGYPEPVYADRLMPTTVIDAAGQPREVLRKMLRPQFQQSTRPSAIIAAMHPSRAVFSTMEIEGACFFRWDLERWLSWCLFHATRQASAGRWPCWLAGLERAGGPT